MRVTDLEGAQSAHSTLKMAYGPVERGLDNSAEEGQEDEGAMNAVLHQVHHQGHT